MTVNLLGFRITHRAMRADTRRLATALNELAADDRPADPARLDAIAKFATSLCAGIHHHHTVEDLELWPVIVRAAGAEVDLSDLTDDHDALDPILDEITAAAGRLRADRAAVPAMAEAMGRLADLLDEHIEEEERRLFPIILKYVSEADWNRVEQLARKGGDLRFDLPRIGQHALPEELAELRREGGPMITLALALTRRGHLRRQRLVFGAA